MDPQRLALQTETLAVIREAIDHHLSDRQRQALKAILFEGVPLDELVRHWGSNRGFGVREMLDLFGGQR